MFSFKEIAGFFGLIGLVFALIGVGGYYLGEMSCAAKAHEMKLQYRFSLLTECMIEIKGSYFPLNSMKVLNVQ